MDISDLNAEVLRLDPSLAKRNYAGNLESAWVLKNQMPVKYLPMLPFHQYHNPKQLAKLITFGYIEWKKHE